MPEPAAPRLARQRDSRSQQLANEERLGLRELSDDEPQREEERDDERRDREPDRHCPTR